MCFACGSLTFLGPSIAVGTVDTAVHFVCQIILRLSPAVCKVAGSAALRYWHGYSTCVAVLNSLQQCKTQCNFQFIWLPSGYEITVDDTRHMQKKSVQVLHNRINAAFGELHVKLLLTPLYTDRYTDRAINHLDVMPCYDS